MVEVLIATVLVWPTLFVAPILLVWLSLALHVRLPLQPSSNSPFPFELWLFECIVKYIKFRILFSGNLFYGIEFEVSNVFTICKFLLYDDLRIQSFSIRS